MEKVFYLGIFMLNKNLCMLIVEICVFVKWNMMKMYKYYYWDFLIL